MTAAARLAAAAAALSILAAPAVGQAQPQPQARMAFIVQRVVDGDTLVLLGGERVRLIGIDAPELGARNRREARLAREATEFARRMVEGRRVYLELDLRHRDRHGRTLGYVFLEDGRMLNTELLRHGLARVYRKESFRRREPFLRFEREAREAKRGIWAKGRSAAAEPEQQRQEQQ